MADWRSIDKGKSEGKHYPIGSGRTGEEDVPSIDEEIEKIMAQEQKAIGFEGMLLQEAKNFMENLNSRYLGSVKTNGFEFHEWHSDFSGVYTWAVVGNGKVAFGGESKSGMLQANEGSATETELETPEEPPPEPVEVETMTEREKLKQEGKEDVNAYVDLAVPDSLIAGPEFVDSRDKKFMKDRQKEREKKQ